MPRRWTQSIVLLTCAVACAGVYLWRGPVLPGLIAALALLVAAVLTSPKVFPRPVSHTQAVSAGGPIIYWRPGCPYCLRLRAGLGRDAARVQWVDIWADPEAAAAVRLVADGNETVPTLMIGPQSYVNPTPARVRELIS